MKIALVNPKGTVVKDKEMQKFWSHFSSKILRQTYSGFSSGLLVLAGLTPKTIDIEIIDDAFDVINYDKKYDLVGISIMTQQAVRGYQIADSFRKKGNKVVIGGIHATVMPAEAKEHADSVAIGEAEGVWGDILNDARSNKLKEFYSNNTAIDLRNSPIPRYDFLDFERHKVVWIQTTRGCPINCEFCAASRVFGPRIRHKSIEQIMEEIRFIKELDKRFQLSFADDNMFTDKKYANEIIKALRKMNIRWFAQTDVSIAENDELLRSLKDSGCSILFIGFESLSKESLKKIDKGGFKLKRLERYPEYIEKIQSLGIGVLGSFILGFDTDDKSVFKKTSDFIINNRLYASQVTVLTPLPGTDLRDRLNKENRILEKSWDNYTFWDVNFVPRKMSSEELRDGLLSVHKEIYNKEVLKRTMNHFKNIYTKQII